MAKDDEKPRVRVSKGNTYGTSGGGYSGKKATGTISGSRDTDSKIRGTRIDTPGRLGVEAPARRGSGGSFAPNPEGFTSTARAAARAKELREQRMRRAEEEAAQPEGFSFADALMQALGMVGGDESSSSSGGGGVDYSGLRGQLNDKASDSDARIAAMYRQLQDSYAADAPGIQQSYDKTGESLANTADQAAAGVNSAYNSARDAQTKQFAELGIGDAAAVLAGAGGNAARDQAGAVANIEQNKALDVNQNTARAQSAGGYNTQIGQAAGLEGNLQRANIQAQLAAQLAELGIREQEANQQASQQSSSSRGQNFSQAMQLAEMLKADYDQQNPQAQGPSAEDQQALAEFLYQQQQDTAKSQRGATNDRNDLYLRLLKQFGGDTERADQVFQSMIG